jgi:hypothetical protein
MVLGMNEPGARSRAIGNVFKGGGGYSTNVPANIRAGRLPDLSKVRLLRGHVPLGAAPHIENYLSEGRRVSPFTFLRDPADRMLSHFFAIRESGRAYGLPALAPDATLDDALAGGYVHDNLHTRMLSDTLEPFGEVNGEMLEQAKRNLRDRVVFFGLTERFDESLALARGRLGLRTVLYRTSGRVNTSRPRGEDVPAELREAADRLNRYDIELYRYAEELFEGAPERAQLGFQVELAALRAAKDGGAVAPPPATGFDPDDAWRMLVDARAQLLQLEFDRKHRRAPRVPETLEEENAENELRIARARVRKLQKHVEQLKASVKGSRGLRQQVERLQGRPPPSVELERTLKETVERLEAARSRNAKLEQRVKRLRSGAGPDSPPRTRRKRRGNG